MNPDRLHRLIQGAAGEHRPVRLLFVCTGNICRSPMAQAMFDQVAINRTVARFFETESAGLASYHVGENADPRMRQVARQQGVDLDHPVRQFQSDDWACFDLILAMDRGHFQQLGRMCHSATTQDKILLYRDFEPEFQPDQDVPDPYYGVTADFRRVYDITRRCSVSLIEQLLTAMKAFTISA